MMINEGMDLSGASANDPPSIARLLQLVRRQFAQTLNPAYYMICWVVGYNKNNKTQMHTSSGLLTPSNLHTYRPGRNCIQHGRYDSASPTYRKGRIAPSSTAIYR
jgi:hypothetical protein